MFERKCDNLEYLLYNSYLIYEHKYTDMHPQGQPTETVDDQHWNRIFYEAVSFSLKIVFHGHLSRKQKRKFLPEERLNLVA